MESWSDMLRSRPAAASSSNAATEDAALQWMTYGLVAGWQGSPRVCSTPMP